MTKQMKIKRLHSSLSSLIQNSVSEGNSNSTSSNFKYGVFSSTSSSSSSSSTSCSPLDMTVNLQVCTIDDDATHHSFQKSMPSFPQQTPVPSKVTKKEKIEDYVLFSDLLSISLKLQKQSVFTFCGLDEIILYLFGPSDDTPVIYLHTLFTKNCTSKTKKLMFLMEEITLSCLDWCDEFYDCLVSLANLSDNELRLKQVEKLLVSLKNNVSIFEGWNKTFLNELDPSLSISLDSIHFVHLFKYIIDRIYDVGTIVFLTNLKLFNAQLNLSQVHIHFLFMYNFRQCVKNIGPSISKKTSVKSTEIVADTQQMNNYKTILACLIQTNCIIFRRMAFIALFTNKNTASDVQNPVSTNLLCVNDKTKTVNTFKNSSTYNTETVQKHKKIADMLYTYNWTNNWVEKSSYVYNWLQTFSGRITNKQDLISVGKVEFRKLFAMVWYNLPPCIRRSIIVSNHKKHRFHYTDQLKFAWFMYSSFFRPLFNGNKLVDENVMGELTVYLLQSMKEYNTQNTDDVYGPKHVKRFTDIFKNKITAYETSNEKNKIPMLSCSTLAGISNEEDELNKNVTDNNIIFSNHKKSGVRNKTEWNDKSSMIICPFSAPNSPVHKSDNEWDYISAIPMQLLTDIEDLGFTISSVRSDTSTTSSLNSILRKDTIVTKLYSTQMKNFLSITCLNCNVDKCVRQTDKDIDKQDITATSEKKIFFHNPSERFLKDVNLGLGTSY